MIWQSSKTLFLFVLFGALAGCSTIEVSVDVLNPEHVRAEMNNVGVRKLQREIVTARSGDYAQQIDLRFKSFATEVTLLADRIRKTADAIPVSERGPVNAAADNLQKGVGSTGDYRRRSDSGALRIETIAQRIRQESVRLKFDGQKEMPLELRALLLEFRAVDNEMRDEQVQLVRVAEMNLRQRVAAAADAAGKAAAANATPAAASASAAATSKAVTAAAAAPAEAVVAQATVAAAVAARSIIGDGSLAATEFAYVVASAPDQLWKGEFNHAYANTMMGSSDVVIRLNSTADFSVKGLLFDASKVAQVASKVLTQTVLVGAQIAGVPVSSASTGTQSGGDALSKSSADLVAGDAVLAAREANAAAQKAAIRSLARSLISANQQLSSNPLSGAAAADPSRAAIHDGIDNTVASLKNILSLQADQ